MTLLLVIRSGPPCEISKTPSPASTRLFVVICNSPELSKPIKPDVALMEILEFSTFKVDAAPAVKLYGRPVSVNVQAPPASIVITED